MVRAFGVVALLGVSLQAVLLVTLHVLPTKYDTVHDAISDYGVGAYRRYFWAQLVAGGSACIALAVSLGSLHPYVPTLAVVMLVANGAARFLMPAFPTDQSGSRFQTARGTVHMVLAIVAFGGVAAAATSLGGLLDRYAEWEGVKGLVDTLGWVVLTGAIACALALFAPRLKRIFGLIERLFTASVIVWIGVLSIELIRFGK
jgi:hypothetical protein